jgi:heavy metal translocating P-type ATPase
MTPRPEVWVHRGGRRPPGGVVFIMAVDPICGMTVDEQTALQTVKEGSTHYFCCDACRRKFLGLPPAPPTRPPTLPYFCPMCEGVESREPGTCPTCGMALESSGPGIQEDTTELDDMTRRFWIGLVLGLPVFLLAMGPMVVPSLHHVIPTGLTRWLELILATPVVIGCGWPFFQRAWQSLRSGRLNMFTLIGLGTGTAYAASVIALLLPGLFPDSVRHQGEVPVYFEAASTIIVLVLMGQIMELRARRKTGAAIRELLKLAPVTAFVIRDGAESEVSLEKVQPGDLIRVKPGGKVPVDGAILEGQGSLDMSLLTGESLPEDGGPGMNVAAGTINLSGAFVMRADKVGADTLFARIIRMVADAQRSRAPVQHAADRAAAVFVPVVTAVALIAGASWLWLGPEPKLAHALISVVSVLIVACPCALGLATPMAVMVGMGRGARAGILIRDAEVLEQLGRVDTVVVDKTGTLTEGRPGVSGVRSATGEADILRWAAAVEIHSEHPIARAIVHYAGERGIVPEPATDFVSTPGEGVAGLVAGKRVRVEKAAGEASAPSTLVSVSVDGVLVGTIALTDRIRDTTPAAVKTLHAMGLRVIMLTGDHPEAAKAVASQLGIDEVRAGVMPSGKWDIIKALKADGRRVAMAGDGVNDAPALAAADVGIAMGTGTDVAMESAGAVLVKGDLQGIARAIILSRAVMRNIRQNLFWAFLYNMTGVPIAAGALYPVFGLLMSPMLAAAAMSFSSVSVIANALRLRGVKI